MISIGKLSELARLDAQLVKAKASLNDAERRVLEKAVKSTKYTLHREDGEPILKSRSPESHEQMAQHFTGRAKLTKQFPGISELHAAAAKKHRQAARLLRLHHEDAKNASDKAYAFVKRHRLLR